MFSLESKIFIDRLAFGAIAYFLDRLSYIVGFFVRRDHSVNEGNIKNIVISKYLGLGSIVRSQVIINNIKMKYPKCKIYYLTSKKNIQLFDIIQNVDDIICIDESGVVSMFISTVKVVYFLIKTKIDIFIDIEVYSRYSSCITLLSCARNRYGFFRHDIHLHIGIYTHLLYFNSQKNITDIYLQICGMFDNNINFDKTIPKFVFNEKHNKPIDDFFYRNSISKKDGNIFIGINANASELALERRYPPSYFVKVIERLIEENNNIKIFLIGSPSEKSYIEENIYNVLTESSKKNTYITAGLFNLPVSVLLLSYFDIFVTTDSGPLHFAYAQNVNIISIWGVGSHNHYGLLNYDKEVYLNSNVYCSPCLYLTNKPPCNGINICLCLLYPNLLYTEIANKLDIKKVNIKYYEENNYYAGSISRLN